MASARKSRYRSGDHPRVSTSIQSRPEQAAPVQDHPDRVRVDRPPTHVRTVDERHRLVVAE
jgi:hypothetical protein